MTQKPWDKALEKLASSLAYEARVTATGPTEAMVAVKTELHTALDGLLEAVVSLNSARNENEAEAAVRAIGDEWEKFNG
jgi:hypothetical protein